MTNRDAFDAAVAAELRGLHDYEFGRVALGLVNAATDLVAELDSELARQRSDTIMKVADRWQWGAWSDVLLPASQPPAVPAIDYAQRVTEWLRAQAEKDGGTDG